MSTCEENNDLLNIFNLISNIQEDLRKLKSLEIPSDENGIKKIKVYISRIIQDLLDTPHVVRSIFNSNEFVQEWDQ